MSSTADTGFGAIAPKQTTHRSGEARRAWKRGKIVAGTLLALNALSQIGGGSMMSFAPARAATEMFGMTPTADVSRLIAIIGGVTLGCFALSVVALALILRDQKTASAFALAQALLLTIVGVVMLATGTPLGVVDIGKGVALTLIALWNARAGFTQTEAPC